MHVRGRVDTVVAIEEPAMMEEEVKEGQNKAVPSDSDREKQDRLRDGGCFRGDKRWLDDLHIVAVWDTPPKWFAVGPQPHQVHRAPHPLFFTFVFLLLQPLPLLLPLLSIYIQCKSEEDKKECIRRKELYQKAVERRYIMAGDKPWGALSAEGLRRAYWLFYERL